MPRKYSSNLLVPHAEAADHDVVMAMTFIQSLATPLFWTSWRPQNVGEYAASCFFLVTLAALTRVLAAVRHAPASILGFGEAVHGIIALKGRRTTTTTKTAIQKATSRAWSAQSAAGGSLY